MPVVDPKDFGFPQEQYREEDRFFAPYPQVDFTPSPEYKVQIAEYERKFAPRPHWFLRFYRMLRRLIRQRQESAALRDARKTALITIDRTVESSNLKWREANAAISEARAKAAKEIADFTKRLAAKDAALDELRQKMERTVGALEETIRNRERDIKSCVNDQIPQLKNELKVAKMHIQHLELLHANKIALIETLTALCNQKIVEADSPINESTALALSRLRGDMGISHGG